MGALFRLRKPIGVRKSAGSIRANIVVEAIKTKQPFDIRIAIARSIIEGRYGKVGDSVRGV